MSGLIWAGIGKGISDAGTSIGGFMMKRAAQEEDREDRQEERRREREDDRKWREEQNALYKRTADQQGSGGRGSDGLSAKDIGEAGADEGMLARASGMTVPELRALRKYSETGDTKPFERDMQQVTLGDSGDPYNPEMTSETVRGLPPGFEKEARAKMQTLARIEESYRLGGKYDDVVKGRRGTQEIDASDAAMRDPSKAGIIGQGMAAGAGKDLVGGDSNVTRNKFTGATSTTPVGESVIRENDADAGKARAEANKANAGAKDDSLNTLQQMRKTAEETLKDARKALTEFDKIYKDLPKAEREKRADERKTLEKEVNEARGNLSKISERLANRLDGKKDEPAPKPAPAPAPAAASSSMPAPTTKDEFDKLPKGTRYKAPDGTIRIK